MPDHTSPLPVPFGPAIVIAAGGAGRRIGGDKPERQLGNQRLIDHRSGWTRGRSDCVAIAAQAGTASDGVGLPLLADSTGDLGPVAALASAVAFAAAHGRSHVLLIGCDLPFLPDDLIARLGAAIGDLGAALPRRGERLHPLAGLWRSDPSAVTDWIADGGRSLWGLAERMGHVQVDWPVVGPDPFANINTAEDLAAAEDRLRAAAR